MADINKAYELAKEAYAAIGVDTEAVMAQLDKINVSIHCWQGDDVLGFEGATELTGGIQTTGNYPGRARTADELRKDTSKMLTYIPGPKTLSLHANYAEFAPGKKVDRDAITVEHFQNWIDWAKGEKIGLDFNSTSFSHPLSGEYSITNRDEKIRRFWIEHTKRSREISDAFGKEFGRQAVMNFWIHDGDKEVPIDTLAPRARLVEALDEVMAEKMDNHLVAVESKVFGIGAESYTVGSHEFYMGYSATRGTLLCLDAGHYHPTEVVSAKITACLPFVKGILLHVSRPVRWDSDHVVKFDDETKQIFKEIARNNAWEKVFIGTDWFDASINRIFAWTIGVRNVKKAILNALLEPTDTLKAFENSDDNSSRLAYQEELNTMPLGAVWDYYCATRNVPVGMEWMADAKAYEAEVLSKRI